MAMLVAATLHWGVDRIRGAARGRTAPLRAREREEPAGRDSLPRFHIAPPFQRRENRRPDARLLARPWVAHCQEKLPVHFFVHGPDRIYRQSPAAQRIPECDWHAVLIGLEERVLLLSERPQPRPVTAVLHKHRRIPDRCGELYAALGPLHGAPVSVVAVGFDEVAFNRMFLRLRFAIEYSGAFIKCAR
eukprot:CAMPEP_0172634830 /NCGR_PEP_ID=MMETSP1068-20121228/196389_1 /TAXON_ID=35684 /ORGANISM="Pseudopedinella elastica, Strain CCMP716" /LENGTH=188 /DNA_ID=CAMNT_0013446851 /DNA_START=312 /DNA_END=878 /DNA_ORIENTATION=-